MRVAAYAFQTIQWKNLQIAIELCRDFRNTAFILQETVMETQLLLLREGDTRPLSPDAAKSWHDGATRLGGALVLSAPHVVGRGCQSRAV